MKIKLVLVAAFALLATSTVNAQSARPAQMANPANTDGRPDTVSNAVTMNFAVYSPSIGPIAFQYVSTKISGTVAGKAYLQASIDPTGISTSSYFNVDSATLIDGNNLVARSYSTNNYYFWRWQIVPTGTSASGAKAYCLKK